MEPESFSESLVEFLEKWEEAVEENSSATARFYLDGADKKLDEAFDKFVAAAVRKRLDGGGV